MWRFLLPASAIAVALIVTLAEGLSGLQSFPQSSRQVGSAFSGAIPPPLPTTVGLTEIQPYREAGQSSGTQAQVAELPPSYAVSVPQTATAPQETTKILQVQDAQSSFERNATRADTFGHDLEVLHQRQIEVAALRRQKRLASAIRPRARRYTSLYITQSNHGIWLFRPQEGGGER